MPRTARLILPGQLHHVLQRGLNGQRVFYDAHDYRQYIADIETYRRQFKIRVVAYCLLPTAVHLLLIPSDTAGMAQMMKIVNCNATRRANRRLKRTGTIWDSRFRSSPVQSEGYLSPTIRYIDRLPLTHNLAFRPDDYAWSSCSFHCGQVSQFEADDHEEFNMSAKQYLEYLVEMPDAAQERLIANAVMRGQLTGDERFQRDVERLSGRRIECRGQGRPRKNRLPKPLALVVPTVIAHRDERCRRIEDDIANHFASVSMMR